MAETIERVTGALSGRYEILRELGSGGMATVFLARDPRHDRLVAIKVLSQELSHGVAADRFLAEITIAAQLAHPHIVPVFDSGDIRDCLYYVMPFVEGETLRARLLREGRLSTDEALRIAREVGGALAYAHARNVVHRDIKPENILLAQGHALIADFGIARAIQQAGGDRVTLAGLAVGTPLYMSPEQARGARDLDGRSDVFSLGCVLYEMLVGHAPHSADTPRNVMARKFTRVSTSFRGTGKALTPTVVLALERALATEPADRFTGAEFVATLAAPANALETTVAVDALKPPARKRPRWAIATAALLVVATVGVAVARFLPRAAADARIVAVFPFHASDAASAQWVEAIPDLLATSLDGIPGVTVADPWSVWRELRADPREKAQSPDPNQAAKLAQRARAEYFMLGSIAQLPTEVQINVRIYRTGTAEPWQTFGVSGPADSIAPLARQISLEAIRRLAVSGATTLGSRVEHRLTRSPDALKAWLSARENRRRGLLDSADAAIDRAVALDSTFVPAHVDAIAIKSWLQFSRGQSYANLRDLAERAVRMSDSASERSRMHAVAMLASINTDGYTAANAMNRVLAIDSTDFDAWTLLSYVQMAYGWQYGQRPSDAISSAERAVQLDPTDASALVRRAYLAVAENNPADVSRQVQRLRAADTSVAVIRGMLTGIDVLRADDAAFAARVETLAGAPVPDWISALRLLRLFRPDRAERLLEASRVRATPVRQFALGATQSTLAAQGRWSVLDSLRNAGTFSPGSGFDRTLERAILAGAIAGAGDERLARRAFTVLSTGFPPDSAFAAFNSRPAWHEGWLIGAYNAMYGDTLLARRWQLALAALPTKDARPARYTEALRDDIAARLASRRGNRADALVLARRAYQAWDVHTENQPEVMPEPAMRFHLATLLRASGSVDSAAALFSSLVPATTWMGFYTARAALELAELREEARDLPAAQRNFLLASRLWERGDSSIGALRDRARRGVQRVAESTRR